LGVKCKLIERRGGGVVRGDTRGGGGGEDNRGNTVFHACENTSETK